MTYYTKNETTGEYEPADTPAWAGDTEAEAPEAPRTAKQSGAVRTATEPEREAEYYVHLADGSVERVAESDLPTAAGADALNGYWQRDGKVYLVIAIHPTETTVKDA